MAFTFFFRDKYTLELLSKLLKEYTYGFSRIKIWDAGSAMGPEPYTFAIILREELGEKEFKKVQMFSSDLDEYNKYGKIINEAVYPLNELERMPEDLFFKYFSQTVDPNLFKVNQEIRNSMRFTKHDLLTLKPFESNFHAVICKNVLLHFQPHERLEVIKMFHNSLEENGLFITEQTQIMPSECSNLFKKAVSDASIYRKITS